MRSLFLLAFFSLVSACGNSTPHTSTVSSSVGSLLQCKGKAILSRPSFGLKDVHSDVAFSIIDRKELRFELSPLGILQGLQFTGLLDVQLRKRSLFHIYGEFATYSAQWKQISAKFPLTTLSAVRNESLALNGEVSFEGYGWKISMTSVVCN